MIDIIYDDAEVMAALQNLLNHTGNIRPALLKIGEKIVESTKHRFETMTAPDGSQWAANSEVTIDRKGHDRPLTGETRTLIDTIRSQLDGDFAVLIGSNKDQAAMMQFGGTKNEFPNLWGNIPGRAYLGISDADKAEISVIMRHHLSL